MRDIVMKCVLAAVLFVGASGSAVAQADDPIAVLRSDADIRAKATACRALAMRGGPEAVPALEELLTDENLSHLARYALEPMPCDEAGEALRNALGRTTGYLQVGIINSLANRDDAQAVPALIVLLSADDAQVAQAAAKGLGMIATPEGAPALMEALGRSGLPPSTVKAICDGLCRCAEALIAKGQQAQAAALYDHVLRVDGLPTHIRAAALRGTVLARGGMEGAPLLVEALHDDDEGLFSAALRIARELDGGEDVTAALADELSTLAVKRKIRLIQALGYRGGTAGGPAVLAAAGPGPVDVREAALRGLARMAYEPALQLMEELASREERPLADVARECLGYFPGEAGDAVVRAMLKNPESKARRAAVAMLEQGALAEPASLLMGLTEADPDESVRAGALKAVGRYATLDEMPGLLARLLAVQSQAEREAAEDALRALFGRQMRPAPAVIVEACSLAFETASGETKHAVLRLLGSTGSAVALETVQAMASDGEGEVQETALRVLCDWPAANALPAIMELVKASPDATVKVLALRGAVRLLKEDAGTGPERLRLYAALMETAATPDGRMAVLSGLGQLENADALDVVMWYLGDESVKAEAAQAAVSIATSLGESARKDTAFFNGKDLTGWEGTGEYWKVKDGAITGRSRKRIPKNEFLWSDVEVRDFYLVVDVMLEPNSANAGIQFRSKKANAHGQAIGYQADMGLGVWGKLHHEHGRRTLDSNDRAEKAVKPGEWNRYEILAVGPAIWTAINGTLGTACVDADKGERAGHIALQIHSGPPHAARYRIEKLVHNPKVELVGMNAEALIAELAPPLR